MGYRTRPEDLIRGSKLARLLGVAKSTVTKWRQVGWIEGYRIGSIVFYDLTEVLRIIKGNPMGRVKRRRR